MYKGNRIEFYCTNSDERFIFCFGQFYFGLIIFRVHTNTHTQTFSLSLSLFSFSFSHTRVEIIDPGCADMRRRVRISWSVVLSLHDLEMNLIRLFAVFLGKPVKPSYSFCALLCTLTKSGARLWTKGVTLLCISMMFCGDIRMEIIFLFSDREKKKVYVAREHMLTVLRSLNDWTRPISVCVYVYRVLNKRT